MAITKYIGGVPFVRNEMTNTWSYLRGNSIVDRLYVRNWGVFTTYDEDCEPDSPALIGPPETIGPPPKPIENSSNSPEPIYINDPPPEVWDNGPPLTNVEDTLPARLLSQESGYAPFETLFHDLQLTAQATYNFWEEGEDSTSKERGVQILEEVPRYVLLSWKMAPDLKHRDEFKKNRLKGAAFDGYGVFVQLSPFGFGARSVMGFHNNGINWTPPSLQPESFEQNVSAVANGYVAPGVIEAVVTVQTGTVNVPPMPTAELIDQDEFLLHSDMFEGITYPEFNAACWRWQSATYGLQMGMGGTLSPTAEQAKNHFWNGKFAIPAMQQAGLNLKAVSSYGPAISLYAPTADSPTPPPPPRPFQLAAEMGMEDMVHPLDNDVESQAVKVKFIHTNMQGLLAPQRIISANSPEHAESVIAIAPFAGNLAVYAASGYQQQQRDLHVPSFPAPEGMKPIEYIGYVIEKYEQVNGSFKLVETINIPGREYDQYYDTKVKYGVAYRYRIKAIARWVRPIAKGIMGNDPTSYPSSVAGLDSIAPNKASYFASEWGHEWANAMVIDTTPPMPPDEFTVRPNSKDKYVEITMKLPWNPQQDINKMTLWRKVQDEWGNDQTGWVQLTEFDAQNRQGTKLSVMVDYEHQQDDITGTKYSAAESQKVEPFVEFAPLNSRYLDITLPYFGDGSRYRYVYAGLCHSRHGETSRLSDQLAVRLNSHWKKEGEYPVNFVSCAGVDKDFDTGVFTTYPEQRLRSEITVPPSGKVAITGQTRLAKKPLSYNTYSARIESLDTGEHIDVPVNVNIINLADSVTDEAMPAIVQGQSV